LESERGAAQWSVPADEQFTVRADDRCEKLNELSSRLHETEALSRIGTRQKGQNYMLLPLSIGFLRMNRGRNAS
jgi:hypothetical protein